MLLIIIKRYGAVSSAIYAHFKRKNVFFNLLSCFTR